MVPITSIVHPDPILTYIKSSEVVPSHLETRIPKKSQSGSTNERIKVRSLDKGQK